jgi:hypothetical protein
MFDMRNLGVDDTAETTATAQGNADAGNAEVGNTATANTEPKETWQDKTWNFIITAGVALASFFLSYWGLNHYISNVLVCNLIALVVALLALAYVDSVLKTKTKMATPIIIFLAIIMIFRLAAYYSEHPSVPEIDRSVPQLSSETGTTRHLSEIWAPDKVFQGGEKITIEVSGNPVKIVGGKLLNPGVYSETPEHHGQIAFENISNAPSQVKVTY